MGIDILGGLPHNFTAEKNKNKLSWILKLVRGNKKNKVCRVPFRDDGGENLPDFSLQSSVYQNDLLPDALLTISFTDRRSQGGHSLDSARIHYCSPIAI